MKTLLLPIVTVIFLVACGETKQAIQQPTKNSKKTNQLQQAPGPVSLTLSNYYFAGLFTMKNDVPKFFNCFDGQTYTVLKKDAFQTLAKRYEELDSSKSESLYVEIRGYIDNQNYKSNLVISYVNSVNKYGECSPNSMIVGVYKSNTPKYKVSINLMISHKFIANVYTADGKIQEQRITGTWGMLNEETISLSYAADNEYFSHILSTDQEAGTLTLDSKKFKDLTLKREMEYLNL